MGAVVGVKGVPVPGLGTSSSGLTRRMKRNGQHGALFDISYTTGGNISFELPIITGGSEPGGA